MTKSSGTTPTEKYLVALCEKAFLRLWSYPNLFRDQGGGKELCDVLIVFDRDIIIFSDKFCTYLDSGDEVKDWTRWFRRSIRDSARQVFGAERWIRHHPNRIFLDLGCTQPLPIDLPSSEDMRLHRVVVARGAGKRCSAFFDGDSGSLMVRSDLVGDVHVNAPAGPFGIFRIGRVDPDRGYVHVFDDENLDILLSELDTVADFVAYLTRKEAFICSGRVVLAPGEEDLLAYYLTGGMRRTHLRGHRNILKRLLIHLAGVNLGVLFRQLIGVGTPRSLQGRCLAALMVLVSSWRRLVHVCPDFRFRCGTVPPGPVAAP